MPAKMPIAPTADLIQTHKITEDQNYEFKSKVDLNDKKAKSDFLDDVVAFLNAESAYLMIGVREKGGKFDRFEPVSGNRDEIRRRFTSVIQDNIIPLPTKVQVDFIDVEGGFVINIFVPDHGMRPYQNSINGSFYLRTGAQNRPIPRDQIRSMFTTFDQFEIDVERLMERENRAVEDRDIMQNNGVTFHLAIIPREYYERNRPSFNPKDGVGYGTLKGMSHFHYGSCVFRGCNDGMEVVDITFDKGKAISRFFIGDDWLIHSYVVHPFSADNSGCVTIYEFKDKLSRYMDNIADFLQKEDISGPFCVMMAVHNLKRNPKVACAFPNADTIRFPRGVRTESVNDPALTKQIYELVSRASIFGGG